jgi:energy-coupling factor transporter ATP-binding protein EcfA2
MSPENDFLKPIGENTEAKNDNFVPISQTTTQQIKSKDSNFIFFFGTGGSGKSVILASMIYYMSSQAGAIRPKLNTPNSKEAEILLYDFLDNLRQGILPERSFRDKVTRLDLVFEPNNKSKSVNPINLTFLETSGENHYEIKRGGHYHSSIEEYLSANIPLNFILVTGYDTSHQDDALIVTFLNELERKGKSLKSVNAILVVSKWDKSGSMGVATPEQLEHFVNERLPMTSQRLDTYGLNMTYFTIGNVEVNSNGDERLTSLNLQTAQVLTEWLYSSIAGIDINYEGTFWERLFN